MTPEDIRAASRKRMRKSRTAKAARNECRQCPRPAAVDGPTGIRRTLCFVHLALDRARKPRKRE